MQIEHWKILTIQLAAFSKLDKAMSSDFSFSLRQDHSQRDFQGFLMEIPSYPNRLCIKSPLNQSKTQDIFPV